MNVTICIPMYNEKAIIADTVRALDAAFGGVRPAFGDRSAAGGIRPVSDGKSAVSGAKTTAGDNADRYDVILQSDGSTDGCEEAAERAAAQLSLPVRVLRYPDGRNRGKGAAVRAAMLALAPDCDIAVMTDADLAYGTEAIARAVEYVKSTGADVVIGSRKLDPDGYAGYTFARRLASRTFVRVLSVAAGLKHSDSQTGIKAFTATAAREIFSRMRTDGFAFDFEALMIADRLGFKVVEMPVRVVNHRASKVHLFRDTFRMLADVSRIKHRIRRI
jgi:dolichyl-phosphate beta-glucosyltransferase